MSEQRPTRGFSGAVVKVWRGDPDPAAGTVDIDFAMHDGLATRWAQIHQGTGVLERLSRTRRPGFMINS